MRCTGRGVLRVQRARGAGHARGVRGRQRALPRRAARRSARDSKRARPLRKDDVPEALRAMRRIAGLSVTVNTRRDAEVRNAFELLVKADFSAVDGVVRMNNRGTDQVGPAFLLGQLFVNGLFGPRGQAGPDLRRGHRSRRIPRRRPVLRHGARRGRHARQRCCCSARTRRPTRAPVNFPTNTRAIARRCASRTRCARTRILAEPGRGASKPTISPSTGGLALPR